MVRIKKMPAETSEKLLINISSKTEIKSFVINLLTQDLQIEQAQKYIQLGISKWSFHNIKTKRLVTRWSFSEKREFCVAIKS